MKHSGTSAKTFAVTITYRGKCTYSMNKPSSVHENFVRPDDVKIGSDRAFGFVFAAACAAAAGYMLWKARCAFWEWLCAAAEFFCLAVFYPRAMKALNPLW